MFTFGLAGGVHGFDPLILLLVGLVVEAYVGAIRIPFGRIRHPVEIVGGWVDVLERKLNREQRSQGDRAIRGLLAVVVIAGACFWAGWGVAWITQHIPFGWSIELLLVIVLLSQRGLYDAVRAVARALTGQGLEAGREAVSHIVGRDPRALDDHGVARAAIESAAENFCDGVVAPVFWYVLFGFPGLAVYKAVNTMDSMIGHRTPRFAAFGMTAARLDDVLNLIPARLAGLFFVLAAAFVPKARPGRALKIMLRDAAKHRSMNAGWPEGAVAGALDLALAGPRRYARHTAADSWIGDGSAKASARDIHRALYLYVAACLINVLWVGAIAMVRFSAEG